MSAILPYDEQTNGDPEGALLLGEALEPREYALTAAGPTVGVIPMDPEFSKESLDRSHTMLTRLVYARAVVAQALAGVNVSVSQGRGKAIDRCQVFLTLDRELPKNVVPWMSMSKSLKSIALLSSTGKMVCPSFSLPSGPLDAGGSCPAAAWTVSGGKVPRGVELEPSENALAATVCQNCYTQVGHYGVTGNIANAVVRYLWTKAALAMPAQDSRFSNAFVETMVAAVANAHYNLCAEPAENAFFRIHDSGDFFSVKYLEAWKEIADNFVRRTGKTPRVVFWAPTRMWVFPKWVEAVNRVNGKPRNLTIRPSVYSIGEPAPRRLGPGWAAGTTVFPKAQVEEAQAAGDFDWNCAAFASQNKEHNCQNGLSPEGNRGCRACWQNRSLAVNYVFHY